MCAPSLSSRRFRLAPSRRSTINGGAATTSSYLVNLTVTATDYHGVQLQCFSNQRVSASACLLVGTARPTLSCVWPHA